MVEASTGLVKQTLPGVSLLEQPRSTARLQRSTYQSISSMWCAGLRAHHCFGLQSLWAADLLSIPVTAAALLVCRDRQVPANIQGVLR